jgi:dynein intermediate chain 1
MVLQSSKLVPSSRQNQSRRSTESANPGDNDVMSRTKQKSTENKPVPPKKKKTTKDEERQSLLHVQEPTRRIAACDIPLELTANDLEAEITRILTGENPNKPKNVCRFSYKDKCFKPEPAEQGDNIAVHFYLQGSLMHVDSNECKEHRQREGTLVEEHEPNDAVTITPSYGSLTSSAKTNQAKNQFNFSERASQTFNNPLKSRGMNTEPPPITQYQDEINQWKVFDSYTSDFILNQSIDKQDGSTRNVTFEDKLASIVYSTEEPNAARAEIIHCRTMENALKTMERLINQNAEDEIFHDFKYFEDKSDEFRNGEGTLLPLWRFSTERTNRKQVTSLCWNPRHKTMFAVGFGSYDFMRQGIGMVCCFSLKNTSSPEYLISTESGVTCLDFHPQHPSLLAVGCYNGTVLVYDISNRTKRPIYSSSLRSGKHSDPVWQICWHDCGCLSKELDFYSISTDGKVANWTMNKNELKMEPIMLLKLINPSKEGSDDLALSGLACGCAFDFNKKLEDLFLVGTEEGSIHECSKAYRGQYIKTYDGHHMGIHRLRWNPFHADIFISCSADWTVKLWDHKSTKCLLNFDLGSAVGDVCWSPYSSTVFAAVTTDGKVHVFDLSKNKREPLCAQRVVKRAGLTNASFNTKDFILIVGDDRGAVHSLKLSPNLRKDDRSEEDRKEEVNVTDIDAIQKNKMVKVLSSIDKKYAQPTILKA